MHLGSSSKTYANAGNPLLPVSTFNVQHRGYDNFMVVLDWMTRTFRQPQKILVTGSSAGAYGAVGHSPWILESYPTAHTYVIGDAGQGVNTRAFDQGNPGRNSWNPQLAPWVFGTDPSLIPGIELMRTVADAYPRSKFSQFTTNLDSV